jgi:hypothetical protein
MSSDTARRLDERLLGLLGVVVVAEAMHASAPPQSPSSALGLPKAEATRGAV